MIKKLLLLIKKQNLFKKMFLLFSRFLQNFYNFIKTQIIKFIIDLRKRMTK